MKKLFLLPLLLAGTAAWAQEAVVIYRCGNTYTNDAEEARARADCKVVEGGNVTVIHDAQILGAPRTGQDTATPAPSTAPDLAATPDPDMQRILRELEGMRKSMEHTKEEEGDGRGRDIPGGGRGEDNTR